MDHNWMRLQCRFYFICPLFWTSTVPRSSIIMDRPDRTEAVDRNIEALWTSQWHLHHRLTYRIPIRSYNLRTSATKVALPPWSSPCLGRVLGCEAYFATPAYWYDDRLGAKCRIIRSWISIGRDRQGRVVNRSELQDSECSEVWQNCQRWSIIAMEIHKRDIWDDHRVPERRRGRGPATGRKCRAVSKA